MCVLEAVDDFEVPVFFPPPGALVSLNQLPTAPLPKQTNRPFKESSGDSHPPASPLYLLHDVQRAVHNELVHDPRLLPKPGDAVATGLRGAEFVLEEGVVFRADYSEVVGHSGS
jgi:hypothetical protein